MNQRRVQATVTSLTSNIGVEIAGDKEDTKYILNQAEIPVPKGDVIRSESGLEDAVDRFGYPLWSLNQLTVIRKRNHYQYPKLGTSLKCFSFSKSINFCHCRTIHHWRRL